MTWLRLSLGGMGGWPYKLMGRPDLEPFFVRRYLIFIIDFVAATSLITHLVIAASDLNYYDTCSQVITICLNVFAVIFHQVHRICYFYSLVILGILYGCIVFFNLVPLYGNYSAGMFSDDRPENATFKVTADYAVPFSYSRSTKGYIAVYIFALINSYPTVAPINILDLLVCIIVFHLWGHLNILIHQLETIPKPKREGSMMLYSRKEKLSVMKCLKKSIDYHNLILDFTFRLSDVFGPMFFCFYVYTQIVGCMILFMISDGGMAAVVRYFLVAIMVFQQLIQLSVVFELLGSTGEKLTEAIYGLPWECMDLEGRRIVLTMLMRSQKPLSVKAIDMIDVGVRTMATILKTTISYFLMLRTTNSAK